MNKIIKITMLSTLCILENIYASQDPSRDSLRGMLYRVVGSRTHVQVSTSVQAQAVVAVTATRVIPVVQARPAAAVLAHELHHAREQVSVLHQRLDDVEHERTHQHHDLHNLQAQLQNLQDQLEQSRADCDEMSMNFIFSEGVRCEQQRKIRELQKQIHDLEHENARLQYAILFDLDTDFK